MKNIYIIEGFDNVGKTTFMKEAFPTYKIYQGNRAITDEILGKYNSWPLDYGVIDFLEQLGIGKESRLKNGVLIERGIFSDYVYNSLYNRSHHFNKDIISFYKNNEFFKNYIGHIYIRHNSTDTAEELFINNKNKSEEFRSFSDYWVMYNLADQYFREIYAMLNIKPIVFETIPGFKWKEVK